MRNAARSVKPLIPHTRRALQRRGIAMLLVLICLAVATVSVTAYVASRDNSVLIGENVASSAAARWAASSGLELAVATLETTWDWRSQHVNGALFTNLDMAGAAITVRAMDLTTEAPPSEDTTFIRLESTAEKHGVSQTASAVLYVPKHSGNMVAVDLSEFAAFASESMELREQAVIMRWPKSPLSRLGSRVFVGTQSSSSSSIAVRDDAAALDATAFGPPSASSYLVDAPEDPHVPLILLPDTVPFPAAPPLVGVAETVHPPPQNLTIPNTREVISANVRLRRLEIKGGSGALALTGEVTLILEEDLRLLEGGTLEVEDDAVVVVFGNLRVDEGAILLSENASLTMFVKGRTSTGVEFRDAYVGQAPREITAGALGEASWFNPFRIIIYSMEGAATEWRLRGETTFKGSLYAPDPQQIRIEELAAVYGRVACRNLNMRDDSAIYYCPTLNTQNGYTNLDSALYDEDGRLREEFRLLTALDDLVLDPIASTMRTVIRVGRRVLGDTSDGDLVTNPDEETPRDGTVLYNPLAFGSDVSVWEEDW